MDFLESFRQNGKPSHVQSVGRALLLIELLACKKREMSLTEISNELGWPKSTVHGTISTLRDYHYIDQSSLNGCYRLGVHLFELGNVVKRTWDISKVAKDYLVKLNAKLDEMVQLAAENDGEVLYLDKLDSNRIMRIVSEVGVRLPMHCSGLGKVLLAYKQEAQVKRIISQKGMKAMTSHTIVTLKDLLKELEKIREKGYAFDDQEIMEGLRCVAAPIFNSSGKVLYAVSVSGLYDTMRGPHLEDVIFEVKKTAQDISYEMGYREPKIKQKKEWKYESEARNSKIN